MQYYLDSIDIYNNYDTGPPHEHTNGNQIPDKDCRVWKKGLTYRGTESVTRNGDICQRWSAQKPNSHPYKPVTAYENKGLGDHSFCRNPDNKKDGPWCYTTTPGVAWATCDIPICGELCWSASVISICGFDKTDLRKIQGLLRFNNAVFYLYFPRR